MKVFQVNYSAIFEFNIHFAEHFPKPYTKAEQRMFKIDDNKLSETTEEEEQFDEEENKQYDKTQGRAKEVSKSI